MLPNLQRRNASFPFTTKEKGKELHSKERYQAISRYQQNAVRLFQEQKSIFLLRVKLTSSHTKKRPHCLTFGRMYEKEILDMFELVVDPNSSFLKEGQDEMNRKMKKFNFAFKPVFVAVGDVFEEDPGMGRVRNFFNDFIHANESKVNVSMTNAFKIVVVLTGLSTEKLQLAVYSQDLRTKGRLIKQFKFQHTDPLFRFSIIILIF